MAFTLVQTATGTGGIATFASPPGEGHLMIAAITIRRSIGSFTPPAGWVEIDTASHLAAAGDRGIILWYRNAQAGESSDVDPIVSNYHRLSIAEFDKGGTLVDHAMLSNQSAASSYPIGPVTVGSTGLLVAITGTNDPGGGMSVTFTDDAAFTRLQAGDSSAGFSPFHLMAYRAVAAGSYSETPTSNRIVTWGSILAAFEEVSAAALHANFAGTPLSGNAPLDVDFTDLTSGGDPANDWDWDFGDGGTSTSQNPSHTYTDPGSYTVALTVGDGTDTDTETKVGYVVVNAPGGSIEFDDAFVELGGDIKEWTIQRGAPAELTGGSSTGSATITLINRDNKYNPENAAGPYYGFLRDGPRVWVGINEDGTIAFDAGKTVHGLFAGRITDLSVLPGDGTSVPPFVELVCADPLDWMSRQRVTLADSRTRSQADVRAEVLGALGVTNLDLCPEPTTLPLSGADGLALNILDALNASNGTRHFAKPADNPTDWYVYTSVRRTSGLDGTSDASVDAGAEHVTGTSGWRISADGVINQQRASVTDITFPARVVVWQHDVLPLTVTDPITLWADFGDYVDGPVVEANSDGDALTTTLTPFGDTAKIELSSAGTSVITSLVIRGRLVQRGSTLSVVIDDEASQADSRGIRAGSDLTGDYVGTITSAEGFARHIVYRFADARYRPTMTVVNWFPEMFELDLFDRISFTSSQLGLTGRLFEIVGLTHHGINAAADGAGNPTAVYHETTFVLQECREQTDPGWWVWDVSEWDEGDVWHY